MYSNVYQDFARYQDTVESNIELGDIRSMGTPQSYKRMEEYAKELGIYEDIAALPESFTTPLGKLEDGSVDLSGGQWQCLAIARGFYRKHNLIVLDEPTSAIDPLEETRVYEKFAEMSKDKTAVIITHRLGSAKIADRIVVLDEGRIVETGTHEELMEQKGYYYEMYQAQAKWYA